MSLVPDTDHLLMDAEHRTLLHWAMQAVDCLRESRAVDESFYAVDVLAHLSRSHFAHEEAEMEAARYPRRGFHCLDHEKLLASLARLRGGSRSREATAAISRLYGAKTANAEEDSWNPRFTSRCSPPCSPSQCLWAP